MFSTSPLSLQFLSWRRFSLFSSRSLGSVEPFQNCRHAPPPFFETALVPVPTLRFFPVQHVLFSFFSEVPLFPPQSRFPSVVAAPLGI